uniref:RNA-directed DNA polymerase, eukaryota, nucleotide-binding alpha-beta plait domain protein n=1 Tax=Tanacetum cinerariifolium TaxID=118510 RepID=A0A6L2L870_TANCI|nr:RNA-directed DNA polymerase, eukaryota, nucleotide-binding alpha-beta plait domain protein [Tanacetum cinerariifolium]
MFDRRSKEDDVHHISTSLFVTNFPDQTTSKELWRNCKQYGNVIDVFIPNRMSKSGKRFGFVRFIKTSDVDRLVNNLRTIWIDRFKLHPNIARFHRPLMKSGNTHPNNAKEKASSGVFQKNAGVQGQSNSYLQAFKSGPHSQLVVEDSMPAMVLDDSCFNNGDFSLSLVGKLKEFDSLTNLKLLLEEEGFSDIIMRYMGGFWVLFQFLSKTTKDNFMSHVGVSLRFSKMQQASISFKIDERATWIDIEGVPLCAWSHNTFVIISSKWGSLVYDEDKDAPFFHRRRLCIITSLDNNIFKSFKIIVKGKIFWIRVKEVSWWAPNFKDTNDFDDESVDVKSDGMQENVNSKADSNVGVIPDTVFEQSKDGEIRCTAIKENHKDGQEFAQSDNPFNIYDILNKKQPLEVQYSEGEPKFPLGFTPNITSKAKSDSHHSSIGEDNQEKEESGRKNNFNASFKEDGDVSVCSGHFKSVEIPKTGGSILQLTEDLIKSFGWQLRWYSLCLGSKHVPKGELYDSLLLYSIMGKWTPSDKNLLIISVYAPQDLGEKKMLWQYLNHMIDRWKYDVIVMGGFNEVVWWRTCPNISAIILDRYLSDHRLILLRETNFDYGPTPFRFYHYWFELEGFDSFVVDTWIDISISEPNAMLRLLKKLKTLKDKGEGTPDILEERLNIMNNLSSLEKIYSLELAQKAKVKWSIEGDENSKYFHGIINKQRNNLAIHGIIVYGTWIEDPKAVKNEFLSHFKDKFNIPWAVWDCGLNRSPGPDGFTFGFYRGYWNLLEADVVDVVTHFFDNGYCPIGGNYSFITLILKSQGAKQAFDSVRWDFLDDVLKNFGFGVRWHDVVFLGQWCDENLNTIVRVLECFFRASGLRINLHKSKLIGLDVENSIVDLAAHNMGCMSLSLLFMYLGVKINIVRDTPHLFNKGIDLLGFIKKKIGNGEHTMFWEDSWKGNVPLKTLYTRIYALEAEKNISVAAKFVLPSFCSSLRRIPRGGVEQNQLSELLAILEGLVLPNMLDRRSWSLSGSGEFSVSSIRKLIDDHTLKAISSKTRWIKIVPIKINIHAWRVKLDNLPTRLNLSPRGMDLDSIFCPNCNLAVESTDHIFFQCSLVKEIYNKIAHWWDIDVFVLASYDEWWSWFSSLRLSVKLRTVLEGVFYITWSLRNSPSSPRDGLLDKRDPLGPKDVHFLFGMMCDVSDRHVPSRYESIDNLRR